MTFTTTGASNQQHNLRDPSEATRSIVANRIIDNRFVEREPIFTLEEKTDGIEDTHDFAKLHIDLHRRRGEQRRIVKAAN